MFTGIVEGMGKIRSISRRNLNATFEIEVDFDLEGTNVGDSIAIDGCCLTVTSRLGNRFWSDLSDETLRVTNLGRLRENDSVNVERALKLGSRLGGHIVYGHVDGVGKILSFRDVGACRELCIQVAGNLTRYIVDKGALTVDGVSLTVNSVKGDRVSIRVVPHTFDVTAFKYRKVGDSVNLEVDIVGKYVEKLRFLGADEYHSGGKVTEEFLKKHGF